MVVSMVQRELDELAAELAPHAPPAHMLTLDRTEPDAAEQVARFCDELGVTVDVLINNAGFGLYGPHVGLAPVVNVLFNRE